MLQSIGVSHGSAPSPDQGLRLSRTKDQWRIKISRELSWGKKISSENFLRPYVMWKFLKKIKYRVCVYVVKKKMK